MKRAMLCALVCLCGRAAVAGEIYDWRAAASADGYETRAERLCGPLAQREREERRDLEKAEKVLPLLQRSLATNRATLEERRHWAIQTSVPEFEEAVRNNEAAVVQVQQQIATLRASLAALPAENDACRTEVTRRISERLASLERRSVDDLEAIPSYVRLPQEQDRIQEAQDAARAAAAAERERQHQDPALMAPVLSAAICFEREERRVTMAEIATQRKYSRLGGVVNRSQMYRLQGYVRDHDEDIADYTGRLRAMRAKPLPCGSPVVKALLACKADGKQPQCAADRMPLMLSLMPELVSDDDASLTYDFRNQDPDRVWIRGR